MGNCPLAPTIQTAFVLRYILKPQSDSEQDVSNLRTLARGFVGPPKV